jgi:hypothetical protein
MKGQYRDEVSDTREEDLQRANISYRTTASQQG